MIGAGATEWAFFWIAVAAVLLIDFVAARGGRAQTLRSAALWSSAWIGLGLGFGAWLWLRFGGEAGLTYLTAYTLEKSLSVDNLFVFALIFSQTGIPPALQHRALFWGIAGALVMRAVMIGAGVYLLARFHWVIYPFAALLVFAALRMLRGEDKERKLAEASCSLCSSWVARFIPISPVPEGSRFLVRKQGRLMATPLLVALVAIEATDLLFAVDSIPAVLAVTRDPFLVYTSNVFALLGLRSLYFVLAGVMEGLRFLRVGLAVMLVLAAAKMLLAGVIDIPPGASLGLIAGIFTIAIVASRLFPARRAPACKHLGRIKDVEPRTAGCEECLRVGDRWVSLRLCLECGHVGCCDSSKNKHAASHFGATGHPIMRSLQPGERWKWCYVDRVMLE
jgi:tellurite resistance protein TerC